MRISSTPHTSPSLAAECLKDERRMMRRLASPEPLCFGATAGVSGACASHEYGIGSTRGTIPISTRRHLNYSNCATLFRLRRMPLQAQEGL